MKRVTIQNATVLTARSAAFVLATWVLPATARGQIFVGDIAFGRVGEYTTSGATVNASLITGYSSGGVAVSGANLYVVSGDTIAEYNAITGAPVAVPLVSGLSTPIGIALSGGDLFVANHGNNTIGEFNATTGATVNAALVSGLDSPVGIAVSAGDLFVANYGATGLGTTVGEYNATTGAPVNASLVSGLSTPIGIAVSGANLFVVNNAGGGAAFGTIGEYTTSGATVNASLVSGLTAPYDVAVSGGNLFLTTEALGTGHRIIAEYSTSGALVNASLVPSGLHNPTAIAVVPEIPGDVNFDGIVNAQDIALIASQWLQTGNIPADANGDRIVNAQDIAMVATNWLQTSGPSVGSAATVPEASTLVLAALAGLALLACRRRFA